MAVASEKRNVTFPSVDHIPPEVRVSTEPYEMRYLIDGEIRTWTGPAQDIYSPVCVEDGQSPQRCKLGRCALVTEKEALEALDAACRAYGDGRGEWPTASVADRIEVHPVKLDVFRPGIRELLPSICYQNFFCKPVVS